MAEFSMFGPAESGERLARQDQDKYALNAMSLAKDAAELQQMPMRADLLASHARLYRATAAEKEAEVAMQQKLAERFSSMGKQDSAAPDLANPASILETFGTGMMESGMFVKGSEVLARASAIRVREARELQARAAAEKTRLTNLRDQSKRVGDLASGVTDQATYDAVRQMAEAEQIPAFADMPQTYEEAAPLLKMLGTTSLSTYQRANLKLRETAQTNAETEAGRRQEQRDANIALARAREAELRRKRETADRVGAKPPTKLETEQSGTFIKNQLKQMGLEPDAGTLAPASLEVASKAKQIFKANPGLSWDQAISQAFDPNDWAPGTGIFAGKKAKFVGGGNTPDQPLLLTSKSSEWITDKYYMIPGKGTYRFLGGDKWAPTSGSTTIGTAGGGGGGMDDDEEDD